MVSKGENPSGHRFRNSSFSCVGIEQTWKPDLYVLSRILEVLFEDSPTGRTKLCMKSGLNYNVFRRYLVWMLEKGLVAIGQGSSEFQEVTLTRAGNKTRESLEKMFTELSL